MVGVCTLVLIINPFETVLLLQDYFLASIINSHLSHASQLSICRLFKGRKGNDAQNSSFLIKLKCGMDFSSLFFLDVFSLFFLRGGWWRGVRKTVLFLWCCSNRLVWSAYVYVIFFVSLLPKISHTGYTFNLYLTC